MGPVRGMKRRKKTEKKVDQNVLAAAASLSSQPQPIDWWDDFSQRITGTNIPQVLCVSHYLLLGLLVNLFYWVDCKYMHWFGSQWVYLVCCL